MVRAKKPRVAGAFELIWIIEKSVTCDDGATEPIVQSNPNDLVGDAAAGYNRRDRCDSDQGIVDSSEVDVKIFELRGPIAPQCRLNSPADRPSHLRPVGAESHARTIYVQRFAGGHLAISEAARRIDHPAVLVGWFWIRANKKLNALNRGDSANGWGHLKM